jgi:hypothetical protein
MKIKKIAVFSYEDLSDSSKVRARADFLASDEYPWWRDCETSIKQFCNHFGVSKLNYEIGAYCPSYIRCDADNSYFKGRKLKEYKVIAQKSELNGYYIDSILWETFVSEWERTGSALLGFREALEKACTDIQKDMEYHLSEEYVEEMMAINEWEFNEDGSWFSGKEIAA